MSLDLLVNEGKIINTSDMNYGMVGYNVLDPQETITQMFFGLGNYYI